MSSLSLHLLCTEMSCWADALNEATAVHYPRKDYVSRLLARADELLHSGGVEWKLVLYGPDGTSLVPFAGVPKSHVRKLAQALGCLHDAVDAARGIHSSTYERGESSLMYGGSLTRC